MSWHTGHGWATAGVRTLAVSDGYGTEWRPAPRERSAERGLAEYVATGSWHPGTDCVLEATLRDARGRVVSVARWRIRR